MPPKKENTAPTLRTTMVALVPCYNAGPLVKPVVTKLCEMLDHVIVVDDGSTDAATEELEELPITLLKHDANQGKGHALLTGYREALKISDAVAICVLDADGQHDPDELPNLFNAFLQKEADLVIGSRVFTGGHVPWRSRFGNRLTATLTAILLGKRFPDTQSGYRMLSRRYATAVVENVPGGRYETEMEIFVKAVCGKWTVLPIPIKTIYQSGNTSSHFNKYRDSVLVYFRLIQAILRHRFKSHT